MLYEIYKNFEKYGSDVKVDFNGDTYTGKAFVTPLRYKNRVYLEDNYQEGGSTDGGRYTYIGPPDIRLDKMDNTAVITFNGEEYCLKRAEMFVLGDTAVYMWAIIVKCKGGELSGNLLG